MNSSIREVTTGNSHLNPANRELIALYRRPNRPTYPLAEEMDGIEKQWTTRNPDQFDSWHNNSCGFLLIDTFERRDSSAALSDNSLRLVFNGELYNRPQLQKTLPIDSDTKAATIAAAAYKHWGESFVEYLFGDFCFALWDQSAGTLFLVRDYLGWRPIYYAWNGRDFRAATSLAQFRRFPGIHSALNKGYLAEYLAADPATVEDTLLTPVQRLLPGHYLKVNQEEFRIQRYWDPTETTRIRTKDEREYRKMFCSLFQSACKERIFDDQYPAVSLSGGLDSSAVFSFLASQGTVAAYSMSFPSHDCDERPEVEELAALHKVDVRFHEPLLSYPEWIEQQINRFANFPSDPNGLFGMQLRSHVALERHPLLLTGFGGDELLTGGYFRYADLIKGGNFALLTRQLSSDPRIRDLLVDRIPVSLKRQLQEEFPRFRWVPDWVTRDFLRETNLHDRLRSGWKAPTNLSLQQKIICEQLYNGVAIHLREMEYRNTLESKIIARHPLSDHRLINFCLAVPESQLWQNGFSKFVLRQSLWTHLPDSIRSRQDKADFSFINYELVKLLGDRINFFNLPIFDTGWLNQKRLQCLYDEMDAAYQRNSPELFGLSSVIWRIYCADKLLSALG